MEYFHNRNKIVVEYSGNEDATDNLRKRLNHVMDKYCAAVASRSERTGKAYNISNPEIEYELKKYFPGGARTNLINNGEYYEVFTIVEIFLERTNTIIFDRAKQANLDIDSAFKESGSVYNIDKGHVTLKIDTVLAENIDSMKEILISNNEWSEIFYEAVGNLMGRRAKPGDVVRDIFVVCEGYLKDKTNKSSYSPALKKLLSDGIIAREQLYIMEQLYSFRSDTKGTTHAGNSDSVSEVQALWFLETTIACLRFIHSQLANVNSIT
jgi:hypothetical protein